MLQHLPKSFTLIVTVLLVLGMALPVAAQGATCQDPFVVVLPDSPYTGPADMEFGRDDYDARNVRLGNLCGMVIHGNNRDNRIFGSTGDDVIFGYAGNDAIVGGLGDDTLYGGDESGRNDWNADIIYGDAHHIPTGLVQSLSIYTPQAIEDEGFTQFLPVLLGIIGISDPVATLDPERLFEIYDGEPGDDSIFTGDAGGEALWNGDLIIAGSGDDMVTAGTSTGATVWNGDLIFGGSGNDLLSAGRYAGNEGWRGAAIMGGLDDDQVNGGDSRGDGGWSGDLLLGNSGNDILQGGSYTGNEGWNGTLAVGGDGNDLINGSSAQGNEGWNGDVLVGAAQDDRLVGGNYFGNEGWMLYCYRRHKHIHSYLQLPHEHIPTFQGNYK